MSERQVVELPAVFDAANRKKDRSLSLRLTTTQEISNQDFAAIDRLVGTSGHMLFAANRFSDADIPTDDAPSDSKKPSQRLRSVLYILHQQEGDGEDFDAFYNRKMNRIIDWVKDKLD